MAIREKIWIVYSRFADTLQVLGVQGVFAVVSSFALPAWAVWYAQMFAQYSPASWVIAGFCGVLAWAVIRLLWQWANTLRVRALFDARSLERGELINPVASTFERKRIFLNDFVLPSHTLIENKNFIDCDLIGPAIIYFPANNQAAPIRPPKIDAVWLSPAATFYNGFVFINCIFRNCSFQRVTMFASIENYEAWKDNPNINWISIPPSEADVRTRFDILRQEAAKAVQAPRASVEETSQQPTAMPRASDPAPRLLEGRPADSGEPSGNADQGDSSSRPPAGQSEHQSR